GSGLQTARKRGSGLQTAANGGQVCKTTDHGARPLPAGLAPERSFYRPDPWDRAVCRPDPEAPEADCSWLMRVRRDAVNEAVSSGVAPLASSAARSWSSVTRPR